MSNLAKVIIEELEVEEVYVTDVLKCLLHTIVFHRSLGEITPSDCECENLPELRYPTAEIDSVNKDIDTAVSQFTQNLAEVSKQIKLKVLQEEQAQNKQTRSKIYSAQQQYTIDLSFYSIRKTSGFFRTTEEQTEWERWSIPIKVVFYFDNQPDSVATNSSASTASSVGGAGGTGVGSSSSGATSSAKPIDIYSRKRSSSIQKQSVNRLIESVEQRMKYILKMAHEKTEHLPPVKSSDDSTLKHFQFRISLPSISKGGGLWAGSLLDLVNWSMKN